MYVVIYAVNPVLYYFLLDGAFGDTVGLQRSLRTGLS